MRNEKKARTGYHQYKKISTRIKGECKPDPFRKPTTPFVGAEKEDGWRPCGNGYRRGGGR